MDAERVIQQAVERKLQMADLPEVRYALAFLRGDQAGMDREASDANAPPELKARLALFRALVLARAGHLELARGAVRNAIAMAQQAGEQEKAVCCIRPERPCGKLSSEIRRRPCGLQRMRYRTPDPATSSTRPPSRWRRPVIGVMPNRRSLILTKSFPGRIPASVRFSYLPVLRGMSYLARGSFSEAIQELRESDPAELALPASGFSAFFGALYPAYVRGQALLAAGRGAEAAREFRKIIDHRGLVLADPLDAVARLQLARSLALAGQITESRTAYQDLLALWKDADPDLRVLREAKSEFSKL